MILIMLCYINNLTQIDINEHKKLSNERTIG